MNVVKVFFLPGSLTSARANIDSENYLHPLKEKQDKVKVVHDKTMIIYLP